jgi:hypothetical protein
MNTVKLYRNGKLLEIFNGPDGDSDCLMEAYRKGLAADEIKTSGRFIIPKPLPVERPPGVLLDGQGRTTLEGDLFA